MIDGNGRGWSRKFRNAFRGMREGVRGQSSFYVHLLATAAVVLAAAAMGFDHVQWCILVLCITFVLMAEMFNSALEAMARAITSERNPHIADALDIASAAVLVAALGAAIVGLILFLSRLAVLVNWWR
jgi:diacylglycerol kinase